MHADAADADVRDSGPRHPLLRQAALHASLWASAGLLMAGLWLWQSADGLRIEPQRWSWRAGSVACVAGAQALFAWGVLPGLFGRRGSVDRVLLWACGLAALIAATAAVALWLAGRP